MTVMVLKEIYQPCRHPAYISVQRQRQNQFRHHVEGRAGVRDLEVWDAEQIAMYKKQQAENE